MEYSALCARRIHSVRYPLVPFPKNSASDSEAISVSFIGGDRSSFIMTFPNSNCAACGLNWGTMWPLVAEMFLDRKLSVGPPFFNAAFTPFMVALGLILPIGSAMPWKRAKIMRALYPLRYAFVLAVALGGLAFAMQSGRGLLGPIGMFLGAWLVMGTVVALMQRLGRGPGKLRRLRRLPRADWGKATAHGGLGVTMAGIAAGMRNTG